MTAILEALALNPVLAIVAAGVLGLVVGSFLNVVIHRVPLMLEQAWRDECAEYLEPSPAAAAAPRVGLAWPRSNCPRCSHPIRARHNIPLLGFMLLRGHCADCGARISVQYPLVELVCGVLSALVVWHFGATPAAAAGLALTWALIAAAVIDLHHRILPDGITLPMLWLGLVLSLFGLFSTPQASIVGAAIGYLSLWSLYHVFRLLTGKEGMGYGDFKLFALFGAWFGWAALPLVLLLSSVVGSAVAIVLILSRRISRDIPIPFGPYLAGAGWLTMMAGDSITAAYFRFAGLG